MIDRTKQLAKWNERRRLAEEMIASIQAAMKIEVGRTMTRAIAEVELQRRKEAQRAWKIKNPVFFKCTGCGTVSPRAPTKRDAWALATDAGWFMTMSMRKFCTTCKPKQAGL